MVIQICIEEEKEEEMWEKRQSKYCAKQNNKNTLTNIEKPAMKLL